MVPCYTSVTVTQQADIDLVRSLLDQVAEHSGSTTVLLVRRVLEDKVWARGMPDMEDELSFRAESLCILMSGQVMKDAANALLEQTPGSLA